MTWDRGILHRPIGMFPRCFQFDQRNLEQKGYASPVLRVNSCPFVVDLRGSPILWANAKTQLRRADDMAAKAEVRAPSGVG